MNLTDFSTLEICKVHTLLDLLVGDDVFADIVLLGQVEEFADLRGSLRAEFAGLHLVRQTLDFSVSYKIRPF